MTNWTLGIKGFGRKPDSRRLERISSSPNFKEGKFQNPVPTRMDLNPLRVLREYFESNATLRKAPEHFVVDPMDRSEFRTASESLAVRWLGHASALVEMHGIRILTDPVFSERAAPVGWAGPKRLHPSPVRAGDLPDIDVILLSHNHYDHLDHKFIESLSSTDTQFIMPLGVGESLSYWGIPDERITELDWEESRSIGRVRITATPARHFSGRGLGDRNMTQWASFTIAGVEERVFFCGDSGFFDGFGAIGASHGPFDITMIGIGAYNEMWQAIHTNPEEAVRAHQLLQGRYLLPIHWCTFDLALHNWSDPIEWTLEEAEARGADLLIPRPGQLVRPDGSHRNDFWWRAPQES